MFNPGLLGPRLEILDIIWSLGIALLLAFYSPPATRRFRELRKVVSLAESYSLWHVLWTFETVYMHEKSYTTP